MNIVILNKWGLTSLHFREWLGAEHCLYMVASPSAAKSVPPESLEGEFAEVHVVDDYDSSALVEAVAVDIARRHGVDMIIAMSETDLLRAARLRARLGLPTGQTYPSALAYRDKFVMKEALRRCDVPTARYREVDTYTDLLAAVDELSYPLVVKPRRGSSSIGIDIIDGPDGLTEVARRAFVNDEDRPVGLLAESFVKHELFHVDGLAIDGECPYIWPSQMTSTLGFRTGDMLVSQILDPGHPLRTPLQDLTRAAIAALPGPPEMIFHAEVFRDVETGQLLLNEIAARMGGGRIKACFKLAHGVDLQECYVRLLVASAGDRAGQKSVVHEPQRAAGFFAVPPRAGRVMQVPSMAIPDFIEEVRCEVEVGQILRSAASSIDAIATVLIVGNDGGEVEKKLRLATEWLDRCLVVDGSIAANSEDHG